MNRFFTWKRKLNPREVRLFVCLAVVMGVAAWKYVPRSWKPSRTVQSQHFLIESTAAQRQTDDTAAAMELLYGAYSNQFSQVPGYTPVHPHLRVRLYKDRAELRRVNPGMGWAEAFYREPYCRAYYSADETNPYHWMLHETVHQLNKEVAHLHLEKWLEEGLADYFATSRLRPRELEVGHIDPDTYPVWWMDEIARTPELQANLRNGSVIPLRAILTNRGGPSMRKQFNLYYLHWWTLTDFLLESSKYRAKALALAERGGNTKAFEELIGPVDHVQAEWHLHVLQLKAALSGRDVKFWKTRKGGSGTNLRRQ